MWEQENHDQLWQDCLIDSTSNCRRLRYELKMCRESNESHRLIYDYLRALYMIERGFEKEVNLYLRSSKCGEYQQRIYFVSHIYQALNHRVKTLASDATLKRDYAFSAANDDIVNHRSQLKSYVGMAKGLLKLVISFFSTQSVVSSGLGSDAYMASMKFFMQVEGVMIKQGFLLLNHNWRKVKPEFKKRFDSLLGIGNALIENIMGRVFSDLNVMLLKPDAVKHQERILQLRVNQNKATKASTKYNSDVKSKWVVAAEDLKKANANLSISAIAKKIAQSHPGSQETIRKYISTKLDN